MVFAPSREETLLKVLPSSFGSLTWPQLYNFPHQMILHFDPVVTAGSVVMLTFMGFGGKDVPYTLHDFQSVNVASDGEIFVFLSIYLLNDKQAYIN